MLPLDSLLPLIPCPSTATHRHPALRLHPLHPSSSDVASEVNVSPCCLSAPPPSLWRGRLPRLRWLSRHRRCDSTTTPFRPVRRPPRPFPVGSGHRSSSGTTSLAVKYDPAQRLGFGLAHSRLGSGVAPVTKIQHVAAGSHLARGSPLQLCLASPARLVAPLLSGHHSSQLIFNLETLLHERVDHESPPERGRDRREV